ncbi:ABC-F family ATP-binding cassette domain-containing protein [Paradesulfitobacterium aromaticivorans]
MSILSCYNCSVDIAGESLFQNITFAIEKDEKVGLIGPNGAGKTTLLKACLGELPLESGQIVLSGQVGYLAQAPELSDEGTVFESMLHERSDLLHKRKELHLLEQKIAATAENKVLEQYALLTEQYERDGGYSLEARVRKIVAGLGLEGETETSVSLLSGGQKTRLALARLLLRAPSLLILDEPTNHLDLEALEWLESFLKGYPGAVLVVSHDRYFLDRLVSKILCLENGSLLIYNGNFSDYELQRAVADKTQAREAERLGKKIARLEEYIRRNKAGVNARQARGREIMLQRLKPVAGFAPGNDIKIALALSERSGDRVIDAEGIEVTFSGRTVFRHVNLHLRRGERVALLGKNGVGKTTLLKVIAEQQAHEGTMRLGANVKISYYAQEHESLNLALTIIDELRTTSSLKDPEIRSLLARYGFRGEEVFKRVGVLSGGEKSRLALCKLFLAQGNLLLLDEPTNHLDAQVREVLEETLLEYEGTVLVVSHDRYFLNKIATKIAYLEPEGLTLYDGDYANFRESRQAQTQNTEDIPQLSKSQEERLEQKAAKRRQKSMQQLEEEIELLENRLRELEQELEQAAADYEQVLTLHEEYEDTKERLDQAMTAWLEVCN